MQSDPRPVWYSRLPQGSLGLALVALAVCASWAQASGRTALAWGLGASAAAGAVAAVLWCVMPLVHLQRDPVLRRMGMTPWPIREDSRHRGPNARGNKTSLH